MQSTQIEPSTPTEVSTQTAANRKNAEKSTGPQTAAGKARSSRNAVRGALTGRVMLLPTDDLDAHGTHVEGYEKQFKPLRAARRPNRLTPKKMGRFFKSNC